MGSTSTCDRIAVVPKAIAGSMTRRALAWISATVNDRFALAVLDLCTCRYSELNVAALKKTV